MQSVPAVENHHTWTCRCILHRQHKRAFMLSKHCFSTSLCFACQACGVHVHTEDQHPRKFAVQAPVSSPWQARCAHDHVFVTVAPCLALLDINCLITMCRFTVHHAIRYLPRITIPMRHAIKFTTLPLLRIRALAQWSCHVNAHPHMMPPAGIQ